MEDLIEALKRVLASTFCLYMKTHAAHWNVEGPHFHDMHKMLGEQYEEMWASTDETAERIRMLDAYAPGSLGRMAELSLIREQDETLPLADVLTGLVADHETMIALLTEALHVAEDTDSQGIVDYLAGRIEAHSKHRWFLRATAKRV
jgi:starvation-inducible DNA-binding protein